MTHVNIEIKAKCGSHEKIRDILKSHDADFKGTDHQIDTYFKVDHGRLKLREGNIEKCDLIFYQREDAAGMKESNILVSALERDSLIKEILTKALGVLVVVDKQREIYFIENVKFHLDVVEGLGNFVEIEARDEEGTIGKEKLSEQCRHYCGLFEILPEQFVSDSYSDLLLAKTS